MQENNGDKRLLSVYNKYIRHIVGIVTIAGSFGFLFLLAFKEIPANNQRLVDIVTGFVIGTGVSSVYQYLFGTSKNEADSLETKIFREKGTIEVQQKVAETQQKVAEVQQKVADTIVEVVPEVVKNNTKKEE